MAWIVSYFLPSPIVQFLSGDVAWEYRAQMWVWYSLSGTAIGLGCWFVLGDSSVFFRFLAVGWALVWSWLVWLIALYISIPEESTATGGSILAVIMAILAFVATMILLIPARLIGGVRMLREKSDSPLSGELPKRFTLSQLMLIIAMIAFTLGTARLIAPNDFTYMAIFNFPGRIAGMLYSAICNVILIVPVILTIVFRFNSSAWAIVYFAIGCVAFAAIEMIPWMGWKATDRLAIQWIVNEANYAMMLTLYASIPLMGCRLAGYELRFRAAKAGE